MAASPGLWGGRTAAQRRAERRERLVGAAQEIWIEQGWAAVTMRGVCARTSLNDRYFYEDFADREDLLAAVWDGVRDELIAQISAIVAEDPDRPHWTPSARQSPLWSNGFPATRVGQTSSLSGTSVAPCWSSGG